MKLTTIIYWITIFALVTSNIASILTPSNHILPHFLQSPRDLLSAPQLAADPLTGASNPPPTSPNPNSIYGKAWCKGTRLMLATLLPAARAALHISPPTSPWTGSLTTELQLWGYKDATVLPAGDSSCDLDDLGLARVCASLGISPKTRNVGGPHMCYKIVHRDGMAVITQPPEHRMPDVGWQVYRVGERLYRVTNAKFDIAVNAQDGMVTFIDVQGPKTAAARLWGTPEPSSEELPELRALSDVTWHLWNRDCASQGKSLRGIKKVLSVNIINDETEAVVDEALAKWIVPPGQQRPDEIPPWPGIAFDTSSEAAVAILGSPNGAAIGFFLAQHKQQLGDKYVPRITAFMSEGDIWVLNLLMWIEDAPPPPPPTGQGASDRMGNVSESNVVRRSRDGRHVVREHVFHAKL